MTSYNSCSLFLFQLMVSGHRGAVGAPAGSRAGLDTKHVIGRVTIPRLRTAVTTALETLLTICCVPSLPTVYPRYMATSTW